MDSTEMSDQEIFENTFFYFVKALRVLSLEAPLQCDEYNNYNAPWELCDDVVSGGIGALRLSARSLTWEQAGKIVDIVAGLRRMPDEAISLTHLSMTRPVGCETAMNHPAWAPLRVEAAELLAMLEPAIRANEAYFQSSIDEAER
jgi:hypothetical protein